MQCISSHSTEHCTCTYGACDKRGNCCKCVQYHRRRGEVPGCFFTAQGERSYDRSIAHFLKDRSL